MHENVWRMKTLTRRETCFFKITAMPCNENFYVLYHNIIFVKNCCGLVCIFANVVVVQKCLHNGCSTDQKRLRHEKDYFSNESDRD